MATQVLIAHTGQRLQIDASQFSSFDDFKASVARQSSIPVQCIITLTAQGRSLKWQTVHTEVEIYVYDNRLTQPSLPSPGASVPLKSELPLPKRFEVSDPPNSIDDTRSIQSWRKLFSTRREWALKVVEGCSQMATATDDRFSEMDVMLRCLDAAIANLESVVRALETKYTELKKWAPVAQAEYSALATGWEQRLSLARSIPISPAMVHFMTGRDVSNARGRPQRQSTLEDLVDLETARRAGRLVPAALRRVSDQITDLERGATRLFQDSDDLLRGFDKIVARSALSHNGESLQLLQDIQAVAKKIDTDFQTVLEYTGSTRDVLQASKIAANHTERLLPSIRNCALEMDGMLRYAAQARNNLAAEFVEFMRNIADITALSHSVKSLVNSMSHEEDLKTFDYLRLIQQLPYVYASFVAEAVKRREWFDKVKLDSSTLANEMALFQEEETKRRRRWHKSGNVPGLEVNLLGEDVQWPAMTRKDLEDFYSLAQAQKAEPDIINDISRLIADINNPTRQQAKRMKAFKNGSIHEAALGRSGLLIRGDDDLLRSLQDDKLKLENKLKTAESRTQASRPSLGNLFQMPTQQLSDRNDSTISRRSTEGTDGHTHRIQQLESELRAEKERSVMLEEDLNARTALHDNMKGQIEEANSTKRDLLENMEALKREFLEERKSLEDEALKSEGQVEYLRNEARLQRERMEAQDRLLQAAQDECKCLSKKLESLSEVTGTQLGALRDLWEQLSPGDIASEDLSDLIDGISGKVSDKLADLRCFEGDLVLLRLDLEGAHSGAKTLRSEVAMTKDKLSREELTSLHLRETLSEEQAKVAALEGELADGRGQLSQLRVRLTDGETGSESLRKRLEEEEERITLIAEELASRQSQDRLGESQAQLSELTMRLDSRTKRAKDLTQHLYSQNERLTRLLERLGYSVSRQGSNMAIHKIPRSERPAQSANDSDPNSSIQVEHMARKLQRETRAYREKAHMLQKEAHDKIAFKHFRDGDLALFLPTRNQTTGAWAAFNVGFPHYFLREQEAHRLGSREWLVARITRIQERVVDLSRSLQHQPGLPRKPAGAETESLNDDDNDNPFDLSDGLRWYLIDAVEDKPGAPSTPGLAKSTVAANNVEAMADMHTHGRLGSKGGGLVARGGLSSGIEGVSKTLSKSLESRRSSTGSRKALPFTIGGSKGRDSALASETNSLRAAATTDMPASVSPTQPPHQTAGAQRAEPPQGGDASNSPNQLQSEVRHATDALDGL
ncbi:autophagy-related protein 11-domain-containing protein [Lasiosphaeria miniovina]|uniref:Autophagy-related protein 11 n=1 Tax=Lasiosphaeria miniovina TaxID=1954250 RepID=A0AA40BFK0_9PEZI|nr:autophagy-related protein 11-domain-containing protein [Lasiosphaeria miniovina]KAK0733336.1 autophagy-related protein 11-domain-containing protein [Lasiosphaeria miniovina]